MTWIMPHPRATPRREDQLLSIEGEFIAGEASHHPHSLTFAAATRGVIALGKGDADAAIAALVRAVALTVAGHCDIQALRGSEWVKRGPRG